MPKLKLLFRGPVLTASGYGVHARQLLRALVDSGEFDISVEAIKWGETPFIFGDEVRWIGPLTENLRRDGGQASYDVSVQVTIPNEFERRARFNVGVTAGIEVDVVSPEWIHRCNENVDLVVVPSEHSLNGFRVAYRAQDGQELRLTVPITVVHEGFDPRVFTNSSAYVPDRSPLLPDDLPSMNLLHVGLGLDKAMGEDRKNISTLVRWFLEEFKGEADRGLILKSSIVNNSLLDFELLKKKVSEIRSAVGCGEHPRVTLVHGRISDQELAGLYRDPRVSAFISLTHGEGFGLPLLEAAACGLPVVATGWSGHLDFLRHAAFVSVPFDMVGVPESVVWKGVIDQGRGWANPREADAKKIMRRVFLGHDEGRRVANERAPGLVDLFSVDHVGARFVEVVRDAYESFVRSRPSTPQELVSSVNALLFREGDEGPRLIYTMPMSGGDVFLSTAVVRALKNKFPEHKVFFATSPRYRSILEGNPDIHRVIDWQPWMQDVGLLEDVFDEVYTPNLAVQMTHSNWVHRGKGRNILQEFFVQCGFDEHGAVWRDPFIGHIEVKGLPEKFVAFHVGSGRGQWGARRYNHWQDVVDNVRRTLEPLGWSLVQVGLEDEPQLKGCVDLRGKTSDYRELAYVLSKAACLASIDSVAMHMAAYQGTPVVSIFGGSYARSTGPIKKLQTISLLETRDRMGCERACYKNECRIEPESPCVNNVDPAGLTATIVRKILGDDAYEDAYSGFTRSVPRISGYIHVLNPERHGYPYVQSIKSMLGFCSEVVVVDGGSDDGTFGFMEGWAVVDPRIKLHVNKWDYDEPGMDGAQKAFARAMCDSDSEFLWQQDADEVVHEEDYEKIHELCRRFPVDQMLMHLPVVELWGDERTVRTDRHAWKWRLSRNDFRVTHGIVSHARVIDDRTGRVYSKPGMSDGCEYIDVMTGEYVPHFGFWSKELEELRIRDPRAYGERMNQVFGKLPSVYHYSWVDIGRKIRNFKSFWNGQWNRLYRDQASTDRFPDVDVDDPASVLRKAIEVKDRGGEHGPAVTFPLTRTAPAVMKEQH
jgi:ADP-heptose:LPS heptosyltransferase/glycosyltransferase involved in cell wall biosynthesis